MASGWGINGNKGRCYDFWIDFSECMSHCRQPKDCGLLREDYLECLHHSKEQVLVLPVKNGQSYWLCGFTLGLALSALGFCTLWSLLACIPSIHPTYVMIFMKDYASDTLLRNLSLSNDPFWSIEYICRLVVILTRSCNHALPEE